MSQMSPHHVKIIHQLVENYPPAGCFSANCWIVGIEVKSGATVGAGDFKGLKALAELAGDRFLRGMVLYTGREAIPYGAKPSALPVDCLWSLGNAFG